MANSYGVCCNLIDLQGNIASPGSTTVFCVAIKTALTGSLTIRGLTTGNSTPNTPSDWVLNAGSVGCYTHPGNGTTGGGPLSYVLSNSADSGLATVSYRGN